jgi:hypothetical protein
MDKMFYSLEEAAQKLQMTQDQVKDLAAEGKLQPFRDGDRLMFKRDQVDAMAGGAGEGPAEQEKAGPIPLVGEEEPIVLLDSSAEDTQPLGMAEGRLSKGGGRREEAAPAGAMGSATEEAEEESLPLENVGSGSGLLDLTRESDDTSLGAELLDEIYPMGEGSDTKLQEAGIGSGIGAMVGSSVSDIGGGSSGVFAQAPEVESAGGAAGALEEPRRPGGGRAAVGGAEELVGVAAFVAAEPYDPVGSGMSTGMLIGATVSLGLGLAVMIQGLAGVDSGLVASVSQRLPLYVAGLLALSIGFGVVGMMVGKSQKR